MRVLVVDDEKAAHKTTSIALRAMGHQSVSAYNRQEALRKLKEQPIDAIFLDLKLGEDSGLSLFDSIRSAEYDTPTVFLTAYSTVETAVQATRKGAFDYLSKPLKADTMRSILSRLQALGQPIAAPLPSLLAPSVSTQPSGIFASDEPSMRRAYRVAEKAAATDATVLLLGPSGTGKTVLSKHIHERSLRSGNPFVVVHCPSLSKELLESELFGHVRGSFTGAVQDTWGKIRAAEGGTLFLDEIGELPPEIQAKLLRLLQERRYERIGETVTRPANIRVIAATNRDLMDEVRKQNFREDLYYRLNVISIQLPALRNRPSDLENLIQYFIAEHSRKQGRPTPLAIAPEALEALHRYSWPGNLRELQNAIERGVILCSGDCITLENLPPEIARPDPSALLPPLSLGSLYSLERLEHEHIRRVLQKSSTVREAAQTLGINTATLYRKRKRMLLL